MNQINSNFKEIVKTTIAISKEESVSANKISSPIKIFYAFLKNQKSLTTVIKDENLLNEYITLVLDLWQPSPRGSKIGDKEILTKKFPNIIQKSFIRIEKKHSQTNLSEYLSKGQNVETHSIDIWKELESLYLDLQSKFNDSRKKQLEFWHNLANPYITTTIGNSLKEGEVFQESAKLASSVETKWGIWVEKAFRVFNPRLIYVGGGGIDYIFENIAYDVKSGPNVMNKDQVEELKKKNSIIVTANKKSNLKVILGVKEFKVAIVYGNRELSDKFMKEAGQLIIYGPETWDALTGDEWDAYRFYIAGIKHKLEKENSNWKEDELKKAVEYYISSFYNGDKTMLKKALEFEFYKDLLPNI